MQIYSIEHIFISHCGAVGGSVSSGAKSHFLRLINASGGGGGLKVNI